MTLDRTFYSLLLVTGPIRDIGQNFYSLLLVTGRIRDIGQNFYSLLLVTGPIRDIGQNVLQSSVQTASSSSSSHSYCHIFFDISFLEEGFIRNTIQKICCAVNIQYNYNVHWQIIMK